MEDTKPNCNLFQNLREEFLNTVTTYCQPTLNVLLYGDANLSDSENKTISSAVQEFILKTKRFWSNNKQQQLHLILQHIVNLWLL